MHAILYEATNVVEFYKAKVESKQDDAPLAASDQSGAALPGDEHLALDVTLLGRDGRVLAEVPASRVLLARHSTVLDGVFFRGRPSEYYDAAANTLSLEFCGSEALNVAVHFFRRGDLPGDFPLTEPTERAARTLAQLDRLARAYHFAALGELTYRALRKLVNKRAVLACAIFDELRVRGEGGAGSGAPQRVVPVDSIEQYALDTLRELPMDTLLAGGGHWMREAAVEAIMLDHDIEVDEFFMFKILSAWAGCQEERLPVARRLAGHIELKFIDVELLETQVAESGYFDPREIREAVRLIQDSLADRDPSEMERVLVEGAGIPTVNGVYCRVHQEVGLGEEEVLFVKETDDGMDEMGLYLFMTKWHIAPCTDYSNCYYSCSEPPGGHPPGVLVPHDGWEVQYGGEAPPPYCQYLPVTRLGRGAPGGRGLVAPNLEEMLDPTIVEKRRSIYFNAVVMDIGEKRTMTLEQMMNLPEDQKGVV